MHTDPTVPPRQIYLGQRPIVAECLSNADDEKSPLAWPPSSEVEGGGALVATSDPIELAAEILTAFVANNSVPRAELAALFEGLHAALKKLADGEVAPPVVEPPTPAVSIRKSVTPDYLICLDDGKRFKSLRRHLTMLGMTPDQYRVKWKLPSDYPMVAPNYAAQRSAFAKNIGFGLREKPYRRPAGERSRDRDGGGEVGERRHDRGGYGRADERHQAQSQGKEQGGRGRADGPGKTQTRSPAQGDGVSKLRKTRGKSARFVPAQSTLRRRFHKRPYANGAGPGDGALPLKAVDCLSTVRLPTILFFAVHGFTSGPLPVAVCGRDVLRPA